MPRAFNFLSMRTKRYYLYILASKTRVLYVGMTGFLMSRVLQHKASEGGKFSSSYQVNRLVHYEVFQHVETAIRRETEIKKWRREKKIALIEKKNPTWEDLSADWGKQVPMSYRPPTTSNTGSTVIPRS
jgi:putative endonuclease